MTALGRTLTRAMRPFRYAWARIHRVRQSPHSVAAGFAAGAAVSILPFPGLHFVLGFSLAFLTRGGMLAAAIGTVVGNPWTFPFIWIGTYRLGLAMTGAQSAERGILDTMAQVGDAVIGFDLGRALDTLLPILTPMLIGALPVAAATWALFYFLIRWSMRLRQARIAARKKRPEPDFG